MAVSGMASRVARGSTWSGPAQLRASRAPTSSRGGCSGSRASPERLTTPARVSPRTTRVNTTTAVVSTSASGGAGAIAGQASEGDDALAAGASRHGLRADRAERTVTVDVELVD